jgi:hypothetical protein
MRQNTTIIFGSNLVQKIKAIAKTKGTAQVLVICYQRQKD